MKKAWVFSTIAAILIVPAILQLPTHTEAGCVYSDGTPCASGDLWPWVLSTFVIVIISTVLYAVFDARRRS